MRQYVKAIIAFFTLLGTWGATAGADGNYDQIELWGLTGVVVGTFSVFQFPNAEAKKPRRRRRRKKVDPQP